MAWTDTYDTNTPDGDADSPQEADDRIREVKAAVQERENVDHYWPLTGTQVSDTEAGEHRKVTMHAPISTPANVANKMFVYGKDVGGKIELHVEDEDGNEVQITSAGKILSASLDMKDEDDLSSDSATHVASQQSIKAYIDALASVRQVVSTRDTSTTSTSGVIALDDSIPQNTEGSELFTLAITPIKTGSDLIIQGCVLVGCDSASRIAILGLFKDSDADAIAVFTKSMTLAGGTNAIPFFYKMPAADHATSEITFKLRMGIHAAGNLYYNRTSGVANLFGGKEGSTMIIIEAGG